MKNLIEVSHVSKSYGKVQALRDVSFSTLLLPDQGSARVLDADVRVDFRTIRQSVGYMPGRFSLYQDLTVEENLRFFATVFHTTVEENYERIRVIYEQIAPFKQRRAGALSGGMKQKLALCCALVHAPKVLFLDEPTTGVDPVSRREFWKMLAYLRQEGITLVVSTPFMDEALRCDRVAFLYEGEIKGIDRPEAIRLVHGCRPHFIFCTTGRNLRLPRGQRGRKDYRHAYPMRAQSPLRRKGGSDGV